MRFSIIALTLLAYLWGGLLLPTTAQPSHQGQDETCFPTIHIQSGLTGQVVAIPTTSIVVDWCTLQALHASGDPNRITIQSDGSVPPVTAERLRQVVTWHASALWDKAMSCPHPEDGVFFNIIRPTFPDILISPAGELWELLAPTIECSGAP